MHNFVQTFWLKVTVSAGLIIGLILSYKLWLSSRLYPLTPVFSFLKPLPSPYDWALFIALLVIAAFIAIVRRPARLILALGALAAFLVLSDQSRLQPWFYQYVFMLLALCGLTPLHTCRLIVVCTYFWSGLQKLNADFAGEIFAWLAEPFTPSLPPAVKSFVLAFGHVVPYIETGLAIALLCKKTRTVAVVLAISMHVLILVGIGPWGHNSNNVVWPWNLVMIACLIILFRKTGDFSWREIVQFRPVSFQTLVLLLFGFIPVLSFFNLWDSYLSSALYTANKNKGTLVLSDAALGQLPESIQDYAGGDQDRNTIDISDWSFGELNVPPYPEFRIYKNVARRACTYSPGVNLIIKEKTAILNGGRTYQYTCRDIVASPPSIQQ